MSSPSQEPPRYARLTCAGIHPASFDDTLRRFREKSVPLTLREPGCRGVIALTNSDTFQITVFSLWDEYIGLQTVIGSRIAIADVASYSRDWAGPLTRETYAILVLDLPDRASESVGWSARVTKIRVRREYWPALVQAGWLSAEQLAQQQPGFIGAIGLGDPGSARAMFIEFWENRAALRSSEAMSYRVERSAQVTRMLVGLPQHEVLQVHAFRTQ